MSSVILPKIRRVRVAYFRPLFSEGNLEFKMPDGPFVLLGGNTLGKTTTLQVVVFALAGEADPSIEDRTEYQWGAAYFRSRLNEPGEAEVEVEFSLDKSVIAIRRKMNSKAIRSVRIGTADGIDEPERAQNAYEKEVCAAGNFDNYNDFRYLAHRLCYLSENRRSLVWDQTAQLRVIMTLCGDPNYEREFRALRKTLKETDSELRHTFVDIGRLEDRIGLLRPEESAETDEPEDGRRQSIANAIRQATQLEEELRPIAKYRAKVRKQLANARIELSTLNQELEVSQAYHLGNRY